MKISRFPLLLAAMALFPAANAGSAATIDSFVELETLHKVADLPFALNDHQAKIFGDYMLVVGGRNRLGKSVAQYLTAKVRNGGMLAAWKKEADFPVPISGHAMERLGDFAYIVGGMKPTKMSETISADVYFCRLAKDGYPGPWRKTTGLPTGISGHCLVASGKFLYVIGGLGADGFSNMVYKGLIGSDGSVSSWKQILGMPSALAYAAAVLVKDKIVVVGGQSPAEGKTLIMPTTYIGPLMKDGEPTTWYLASSKLPGSWMSFGRNREGLISINNTLVCFGGQDASWFYISNTASTLYDPDKGEVEGWGLSNNPKGMQQLSQVAQSKDWVFLAGGTLDGSITSVVNSVRIGTKERGETQ